MSALNELVLSLRKLPEVERIRNLRAIRILVDLGLNRGASERMRTLRDRIQLRARIQACAERGRIAVVEGGCDCDGVQYDGKVTYLPATFEAFCEHHDHVAKWADGPFHLAVVRPSEARRIRYRSRDRALEAFEDGHPHVLHMGAL